MGNDQKLPKTNLELTMNEKDKCIHNDSKTQKSLIIANYEINRLQVDLLKAKKTIEVAKIQKKDIVILTQLFESSIQSSKKDFERQLLQQRDETTELTVKLNTEIKASNKLKILSKTRQNEITRLNESVEMTKAMVGEKENEINCSKKTILYLETDVKELETSKEVFNKTLLQQRDETTELSVKLKTEIDSGNKLKILSKVNQDEITRLNELKEISEAMIVTEKNKFICSTQTISCLKEDIKSITTSKENFEKQLLQQRDETTDLIVKFKAVIKSGNKQKMLSKENQDEITRLNESRDLLKDIKEEKERMISCLKEDIKELETSKESFGKQLLQQRKLTMVLNVQLKTEIDSRKKVTFLLKERQDEIARLNESRELSETMTEEKERIISCLIEDIKEFETSKEGFEKQLLQQRDETTELTFKLESEIDSSNKEKMLSNERKVEIKMLYEMVDLLEASAGENENELIFSTQTISRLKEDIKELETSKEGFDKQLLHQRDETGELTLKLRAEIESGNKLKILSKNNQDEIIGLNKSIDLSETIAEEKERTISCLKEDIKELETSKEGFGKQSQQQRDETAELSVRLKTMIDSGNKLKILSKERQDEITRLNESRELLETIAEEKERKISCLKEDIKELETSKEGFGKQLLQQRDETAKITLNLNTVIESGNKLKILSKENQGEIIRLNESRDLLEAS